MKKTIYLITIIIVFGFQSFAFGQIFIEQGKVSHDIKPGETLIGSITVHNRSDKNLTARLYWQDFLYQPPYDGSKEFLPKGTADYSCGSWVSFSPQEVVFPPHGKQEISYSINVPEDMSGGYYGVLFIEREAAKVEGQKGFSVVTRVGCLFFLEDQNKKKGARLENIAIEGNQLTAEFINDGNAVLIAQPVHYIINEEGVAVDRDEAEKIYLPPGQKADYKLSYSSELLPGRYTMVMSIDLQEGDVLVKEIDFEKRQSSDINITEIRN